MLNLKKKTAFITALALILNFMAFSVSAGELTISVEKSGSIVSVSGECKDKTDIILRVFDSEGSLVYADFFPAYENAAEPEDSSEGKSEESESAATDLTTEAPTEPETASSDVPTEAMTEAESEGRKYSFEFSAPSEKGTYKVVVNDNNTNDADSDADFVTDTFVVADSDRKSIGGPSVPTEPVKITPWTPADPTGPSEATEYPAYIDPIDIEGANKSLWTAVNSAKTAAGAAAMISQITKATPQNTMNWEIAKNNVAVAGEVMAANIAEKSMTASRQNTLALNTSNITSKLLSDYDLGYSSIEKAIADNNITLNREMKRELAVNVKFDSKKTITITISKALIEKLTSAKIDLITIKDEDFHITYTIEELAEMLGEKSEMTVNVDKSAMQDGTKKIAVNFDTNSTASVKISFPGISEDTQYMAVVDENGKAVGGRYNAATGVIEAKITESGVYSLVSNEKDFEDIKNKSEEMQKSIKILASKGIISGTSETEFSPDGTISRAEVAALLLRVLSQIDPNADGEFTDVAKSDWYFGVAGSARNYGMIKGFEDNSFRGTEAIVKSQILTIASRILKKEMRYTEPGNVSEWLKYDDAEEIAPWAKNDIALTTMANIVTRSEDNRINSGETMTRGEAALIIMRLFYKVW